MTDIYARQTGGSWEQLWGPSEAYEVTDQARIFSPALKVGYRLMLKCMTHSFPNLIFKYILVAKKPAFMDSNLVMRL